MNKKKLDFIIIGAQKSATTTIYKYLNEHDRIVMPKDKEAPFFNAPELYDRSGNLAKNTSIQHESKSITRDGHFDSYLYDAFLEENFVKQDPYYQGIWGKVSPQYMSSHLIPARIRRANPDAKIIAILRHPIKRAFSHYRMAIRRGTEIRPFDQAMYDSLQSLDQGRTELAPTHQLGYESEAKFYAAWSEYGRVLENYVQLFGKENVLVLFAEELEANPEKTLGQVLQFIGAETTEETEWRPASIGKKFHQGGGKPWINPQRLKSFAHSPIVHQIYQAIPEKARSRFRYWFDQINVRKEPKELSGKESLLSDTVLGKLYQIYRVDAALLTQMGYRPPWQF